MIRIADEIVVNRPRTAIYEHLARIESLPDWLPPVQSAERLDDGPLRVGSRARLRVAGIGPDVTATGQVIALDSPRLIALRTLDAPAGVEARVTLDDAGDASTRLAVAATIELTGMLRFAEGLVRDRIEREVPGALAELKARLEAGIAP